MSELVNRANDEWKRTAISMTWFNAPVADLPIPDLLSMIGYLASERARLMDEVSRLSTEKMDASLKSLRELVGGAGGA